MWPKPKHAFFCPDWRTLYQLHTHSSAKARHTVRYVFTALLLCSLLATAALVPDDVSFVWQIAGSSVGELFCVFLFFMFLFTFTSYLSAGLMISVLIPCAVYLKLCRFLHARADWRCWCARSILALVLPACLLCTLHNIYAIAAG